MRTWDEANTAPPAHHVKALQSFASPLTQLNSRKQSRDGIGQSNIGRSRDPLRQILYLIGQFSHVSTFLNLAVSTDLQRTVHQQSHFKSVTFLSSPPPPNVHVCTICIVFPILSMVYACTARQDVLISNLIHVFGQRV